jgi:hypothetical protein
MKRRAFSNAEPAPAEANVDPRGAARVRAGRLMCDLGRVLDISALGLRAHSRGRPSVVPGSVTAIMVHAPAGSLRLACHVVWTRKIAWRNWQVGVRFVDVTPDVRAGLNLLARGLAVEADLSRLAGDQRE